MEALARDLARAPGAVAELPVVTRRPARTAAQLRALGIRTLVGEFTTPYACCEPRVTNIRRAAEILDGVIVPAEGRFSMNEALGERTEARGFVAAPQIAGGRFEDAVGGGVSQVASTLFNAAFLAGLQIVTHTPHEYWISRYPRGREATVSWGGPELVLRNDWPAAVYIDMEAFGDGVRVRLYSRTLGRRVVTATGEPTRVTEPEVREEVDPALPPGARVVDQPMGGPGFTVAYTRKVYRGDALRRDERWSWTYRPQHALVRVGPAAGGGTGTAGDDADAPPGAPDGDGTGTTTQAPPAAGGGGTTQPPGGDGGGTPVPAPGR
jgi:vancomycin resistance protein YoaR